VKFALINPPWHYEGSIYFGCREPHLPFEFGYARLLIEAEGHEVRLFDAALMALSRDDIRREIAAFGPDFTVITTARHGG
jgi:hypothetical protein